MINVQQAEAVHDALGTMYDTFARLQDALGPKAPALTSICARVLRTLNVEKADLHTAVLKQGGWGKR